MEFFAISNGIPVHISDTRKGKVTVLFLHGYLQTLNVWEEFQKVLADMFVERLGWCPRFISIDLPGHGLSGSSPVSNGMDFCADVVKGVLDLCGVSSCVIVGHSLGGFVAQMCLMRYPSSFSFAFFLNSLSFADDDLVRSKRSKEIGFIEKGKFLELVSLVVPNMFYKENLNRVDGHVQEIIANCETHDTNGIIASVRGMMDRVDMTDFLTGSSVDFRFVVSSSDYYFDSAVYSKMLSFLSDKRGYNCGFCVNECGHSAFIEYPHIVADYLFSVISDKVLVDNLS